jgi:hypothetical protein
MQFSTLALTTLFAAAASAYQVLTPTVNSTVAKGSSVNVKWSSVDTDAETFSIYLVNFQTVHWPPTVLSLAQNVPRDDGSVDVRIPCDVTSDYGWQLNFINGTNTYVIYAQSPMFTLTGDCVEPSTTSTPYPTATVYRNTTVTATASPTIVKVVETVVYETPVVWFVQPSASGAMCPPAAQQTVTVFQNGPAPVTCESGAKPSHGPSGPGGFGNSTVPSKPTSKPTSTGSLTPTGPATFTGAASSVKAGGALVAVFGVAAFLL